MRIKSVGRGMVHLLHEFCLEHELVSPVNRTYAIDEFISFENWLKMLGFVQAQYQYPGLGMELGKRIQQSHIGISSYIAQSCETFIQFLEYANRYNRIWYNFMMREIEVTDDYLIVHWDKPAYLNVGLYPIETAISEELQISILFKRIEQMVGHQVFFEKIELTMMKPSNTRKYQDYFKCPISFDSDKTSLYFPKTLMNVKLNNPDPVLIEILTPQADKILDDIPTQYQFIERINQLIILSISKNSPQIEFIAEQLNMNTRMLQIELKKHGITFKALLNKVRHKLALKYLSDSNLSLMDIAFLLGYREQASFNRAFRSWCNLSPSEWRKLNDNN